MTYVREQETCPTCGSTNVTFSGELGAPGYGRTWKCVNGHSLWGPGGTNLEDMAEVPRGEEPHWVLSAEDVI